MSDKFRTRLRRLQIKNKSTQFTNVGIGILSYNRLDCIKRLLGSISKYKTSGTIYVSDESDNQNVKEWLRSQDNIVLINNKVRVGVAGNTNRLLRQMTGHEHVLLLNDDVEVLSPHWDTFYFVAMAETKFHHFCYRQFGIKGANQNEGIISNIKSWQIRAMQFGENAPNLPHGGILAIDRIGLKTIGYLDEKFGLYGMEHVDWSHRLSLSGIQPNGFHDVVGSNAYMKIHLSRAPDNTNERHTSLINAKLYYSSVCKDESRIYHPDTA